MTHTSQAQTTRVVRNATVIALSTMLARGSQFVWALLLAQLLGVAGYGIWGTIAAMITMAATLPEFGMGLVVLRDVARDQAQAGRFLSATLVAQPALACAAYGLLVLSSLVLPYDTTVRLLLALGAISLFVDTFGNMGYNQLLAAEQMVTTSAAMVTHIAIQIAFAFVVLAAGGGLPGLYIATILAGLFRVAMHWIALRRIGVRPRWPVEAGLIRRLFGEGWPIALSSFLALAYQHIDKVLVFTIIGEAAAGYLTAAFVIVYGVIELLSVAALTALFPLMSRLANEDRGTLRALVDQLTLLTLVITLPVGIGISLLAGRLAALLFPRFGGTAGVLEVLIWHAVVAMTANMYAQLLLVEGRQTHLLLIRAGGLAVNFALNLVLLPIFNVQGAGLAILIAQAVMLALFIVARHPSAKALRALVLRAARVCGAGVLMALCLFALRDPSPIAAGIVGALVYAAGILMLRALGPEEWSIVRRVLGALPIIGRLNNAARLS